VLLVEDEDRVRDMARHVLQANCYAVLEACDGEEALRVSAAWPEPIHLLVTDLVMPRTGGLELAERLVPRRPGMKVLFMSGYTDDALAHQTITQSGKPFLQKPFAPAALAAKVREVLDSEDRGQRTEDRGQRTEDRGQRTEDRGQRTEDRDQRSTVDFCPLSSGLWPLASGYETRKRNEDPDRR
jgi:DNA-binding NtrC family response regulator